MCTLVQFSSPLVPLFCSNTLYVSLQNGVYCWPGQPRLGVRDGTAISGDPLSGPSDSGTRAFTDSVMTLRNDHPPSTHTRGPILCVAQATPVFLTTNRIYRCNQFGDLVEEFGPSSGKPRAEWQRNLSASTQFPQPIAAACVLPKSSLTSSWTWSATTLV